MTYREQLNRPEWAAKRQEILQRDGHKCTSCGAAKSEYDGWNITFKNVQFEQLAQRKYRVVPNENSDYNRLMLFGKRVGKFVPFMSEVRISNGIQEPFAIENVRFSERKWPNERPHLVFYYCGESENARLGQLNVHHTFYINGNLAWEYDNIALVTLCYDCHKEVHRIQRIEVKARNLSLAGSRFVRGCIKCKGPGYLPQYNHRDNGICYECDGIGVL